MAKTLLHRILTFCLLAALLPVLLVTLGGKAAAATYSTPTLNTQSIELPVGRTDRITYSLPDGSETPKKVEWLSANPKIATVTNGSVRGMAPGKTVVTLKLTMPTGRPVSVTCSIEVFRPVSSVKSTASLTLGVGEASEPASVEISPADAKYKGYVFASEDSGVATVTQSGVITGISPGNTVVTVTSTEPQSGNTLPRSHRIKVKVVQRAQSLTLEGEGLEVAKGRGLKLVSQVLPKNTTTPRLQWESSNPKIATVDVNGTVRGVAPGTVTITARTTDGSDLSASVKVAVFSPVVALKPEANSISLPIGTSSDPLVITVSPADAKYKGLKFESSDPSIATVDSRGVVTAKALGNAKITITSTEPTASPRSAIVNVTVVRLASSVQLSYSNVEVARGTHLLIEATVAPKDTTNTRLSWTSSNPSVASVSGGSVSALSVGTTVITATTLDGSNRSASCTVTVYQLVTSVATSGSKQVGVTINKSILLDAEALPKDARNRKLSWSTENPHIATVNSFGSVTGVRVGSTRITAEATDGSGKKLVFTVYVEPAVPLEATAMTRYGSDGRYDEFDIQFKNLTRLRKISYYEFDVVLNTFSGSKTVSCYTDEDLGAGGSKVIGRWRNSSLTYLDTATVMLKYVRYEDGSEEYFYDSPVIGSFYW